MNNYEIRENNLSNFELLCNGVVIAHSTHIKPLEDRKKELEKESTNV